MVLAIAVLIPINSPFKLTNAPPLLPGLTAASVWIKDSIAYSCWRTFIFLAFALTIPDVTVEFRFSGFPIANTHSPISTLSEFAKFK